MQSRPIKPTRGYPLIALFLLVTACGIIASLLGPAARAIANGQIRFWEAAVASLVSMAAVAAIGGIIGLFHYRRGRGAGWGLLTGATIGIFVGPIVLAPREAFGAVVILSLGGAVVTVLISFAFRLASRG